MVSTRNSRNHFTSATTERSVSTKAFLVGWNTLQSIYNAMTTSDTAAAAAAAAAAAVAADDDAHAKVADVCSI